MKVYCDYHPTIKAYWDCPGCEKALCHGCVEKRVVEQYGSRNTFHFCRKCEAEVDRIPFEDTVEPFWSRLHKFFLYPLKPVPLILMLVAGFLYAALPELGLLGFLMRVALWAIILKYSFSALISTGNGFINKSPNVNIATLSDNFQLVFSQYILFILLFILFGVFTAKFGMIFGLIFGAFILLSLPAIIVVHVATGSILNALNPVMFVSIAMRIGWSYLVMYLFLFFLLMAPAALWDYIIVYLPQSLHVFLIFCAKAYYTIISYHLMGYVLFQYHEEVGYDVELDEEEFEPEDDAAAHDPEQDILERINMFVKDGRLEDAVVYIKSKTNGEIKNLELSEKYFNILKITKNESELVKHSLSHMNLLAKHDQRRKLVEVYKEMASRQGFAVSPEASFKVASCLNESDEPREAIKVYNRFIKENSRSPLIPKAYYLAANTINEKLNNPKKAMEILKNILKKYPRNEIIPYVEKSIAKIGVK